MIGVQRETASRPKTCVSSRQAVLSHHNQGLGAAVFAKMTLNPDETGSVGPGQLSTGL